MKYDPEKDKYATDLLRDWKFYGVQLTEEIDFDGFLGTPKAKAFHVSHRTESSNLWLVSNIKKNEYGTSCQVGSYLWFKAKEFRTFQQEGACWQFVPFTSNRPLNSFESKLCMYVGRVLTMETNVSLPLMLRNQQVNHSAGLVVDALTGDTMTSVQKTKTIASLPTVEIQLGDRRRKY